MLVDLEWLPRPPADFAGRVGALEAELAAGPGANFHERLIALATTALDEPQLVRLARLAGKARGVGIEGFSTATLGLLGDGTLDLAAAPMVGSGLRHGLLLEAVVGDYGSAVQDAADPESGLRAAGLDFALICPDARLLGLDQSADGAAEAEAKVAAAFARLAMIADGLRPSVRSAVLIQTLTAPVEPLFGSFDRAHPGSPFAMTLALNRRIAEWTATGAAVLVDTARLAASVGLEQWSEPGHWYASKLPFSPHLLPLYADHVTRTLAAVRGHAKKCLVLDLDNTIWGGVIGDDGLDGIRIGQGSAEGEAFLAVQRMALELRARGVVLAVCSKNEEEAARAPFLQHPDMLLREEHIAVFQANWTDKAANLRAIAEALNIGVDALVLLDDNPAERMQVRDALPLVGVPELPDDPALYPRALAAAGYFEATAFSREDRERAGYYQANAERARTLTASGDLGDYLASLDMVCHIAPVDALSRPRVAQLINKSNQFNLTTRRYSEAEVEAAETDPARHAIQVRLIDRFGDNGIIGVVIADDRGEAWEIDTWLMSCRVLGRRVPEAVLAHLVKAASAAGAMRLIGRYKPTAKNRMVAGHYEGLGFRQIGGEAGGETAWELTLADFEPSVLPMRVEDTALTNEKVPAP